MKNGKNRSKIFLCDAVNFFINHYVLCFVIILILNIIIIATTFLTKVDFPKYDLGIKNTIEEINSTIQTEKNFDILDSKDVEYSLDYSSKTNSYDLSYSLDSKSDFFTLPTCHCRINRKDFKISHVSCNYETEQKYKRENIILTIFILALASLSISVGCIMLIVFFIVLINILKFYDKSYAKKNKNYNLHLID